MKKIILTISTIIVAQAAFAQLKVLSNGKIGIGTFMPQEQLQIGDRWTFTNYGSKAINYNSYWDGSSITRLVTGYCSSFRFNDDGSISFDAAASGTAGSPLSLTRTMMISNDGDVAIGTATPSYKLDVSGTVRAASYLVFSDQKFKTNISTLEGPLDKVLSLNGVSYNFKMNDVALKSEARKNYGFIAQDLRKIMPDLVFEDKEGILSVDYIAVIPYLVEAIKEQNREIEGLKEHIKKNRAEQGSATDNISTLVPNCKLYQNTPNPFNRSTQIRAEIGEKVKYARLYIYDMNGAQKQSIDVSGRNTAITEISASALKPGLYYYTLVCDGKEIGTKKMIVTE